MATPIDFLATGTAEQLGIIIEYVDQQLDNIDGMVVIFGTPGLFPLFDVYEVLHQKMLTARKPIFPVLPSTLTAKAEDEEFIAKGRINFPYEVTLGKALCKGFHTPAPGPEKVELPAVDRKRIRTIIEGAGDGYLAPEAVQGLLDAAGIPRVGEAVADTVTEAL